MRPGLSFFIHLSCTMSVTQVITKMEAMKPGCVSLMVLGQALISFVKVSLSIFTRFHNGISYLYKIFTMEFSPFLFFQNFSQLFVESNVNTKIAKFSVFTKLCTVHCSFALWNFFQLIGESDLLYIYQFYL